MEVNTLWRHVPPEIGYYIMLFNSHPVADMVRDSLKINNRGAYFFIRGYWKNYHRSVLYYLEKGPWYRGHSYGGIGFYESEFSIDHVGIWNRKYGTFEKKEWFKKKKKRLR